MSIKPAIITEYLMTVLACTVALPSLGDDKALRETVKKKLVTIVFPKVNFNRATVKQFAEIIAEGSVHLDRDEHRGIKIKIANEFEPLADDIQFRIGPRTKTHVPLITLKMNNAPLGVVLAYATEMTGLGFKVVNDSVVICGASASEASLFLKDDEKNSWQAVRKQLENTVIPRVDLVEADIQSALDLAPLVGQYITLNLAMGFNLG